jgi:hypothetical protein
MAVVSGTYLRYDAKGLREQLTETIYNISPSETPFTSSLERVGVDQTLFEWQTDSLAAVVTTNAQLEGDDAAYTTPSASVRVGNYTQISSKTGSVSGTLDRVNKGGRKSELAYQKAKRGKELKRDIEAMALLPTGGDAGGAGTARLAAALGAWIKTNDSLGTSGASPVYTSGVPAAARTDGTQRAFTETILKSVLQSVWTAGGTPKVLQVGPFNKGVVSAFSGIATRNFDISNAAAKPTAIIASADVYVSDWGVVRVMPNRYQRERDGWVLDFDMLALGFLRPIFTEALAKTGDAEKFQMIGEWTIQVKQEAGLGLAADLNAS